MLVEGLSVSGFCNNCGAPDAKLTHELRLVLRSVQEKQKRPKTPPRRNGTLRFWQPSRTATLSHEKFWARWSEGPNVRQPTILMATLIER